MPVCSFLFPPSCLWARGMSVISTMDLLSHVQPWNIGYMSRRSVYQFQVCQQWHSTSPRLLHLRRTMNAFSVYVCDTAGKRNRILVMRRLSRPRSRSQSFSKIKQNRYRTFLEQVQLDCDAALMAWYWSDLKAGNMILLLIRSHYHLRKFFLLIEKYRIVNIGTACLML